MDVDATVKPSTTNNATTIDDDDDDPVTATYNVFINPSLPLGRRLLVLQHPNRTDEATRPPPTELRVKAQAGMVEVDVPLDNTVAYDREKGLKWGKTLNASMATKNGGSHGLAGGFGFGTVQARGGRKKVDEEDEVMDWTEAVRQDKVLRTQTLGGQYPEYKEVQHMVGVFQGSKSQQLFPTNTTSNLECRGSTSYACIIACSPATSTSSYRRNCPARTTGRSHQRLSSYHSRRHCSCHSHDRQSHW